MDLTAIVEEICRILETLEGIRLTAYKDIVGVWTLGMGETAGVKEGDVWTLEYARARLRQRVGYFLLQTLARCPQLFLEPSGRAVACTSLAYNIGLGAFGVSSPCRFTKQQAFLRAAKAFLLWNKAGGRVVKGLDNRRHFEMGIYLRGY